MVLLSLPEGGRLFPPQPSQVHQLDFEDGGPRWEHSGISENLGFVATWGLAGFCGPCPVDGVRTEEVLRVGTWTPSAIPPGEEILI